MPLEKIPAILLGGLGIHVAVTAPTPPTPKNERKIRDGPVDINWVARGMKATYWMIAAIELCVIVAGITTSESTWPKQVAALLLPNGKNPDCIKLTPTTAFATTLMVLGATIRYLCFRELGRHFTFHVTLLENHKLVTTGPYSIVRHPSYAGTLFMVVGQVIWYTAPGSWLREGMIYQIKSAWLIITPVIFCLYLGVANTSRRVMVEDAMLRKEFGKEWDKWAQAVPYRLFPGIH